MLPQYLWSLYVHIYTYTKENTLQIQIPNVLAPTDFHRIEHIFTKLNMTTIDTFIIYKKNQVLIDFKPFFPPKFRIALNNSPLGSIVVFSSLTIEFL